MVALKTTAQKLVLGALWRRFGGPSKVGRRLDVTKQILVQWHIRGRVPLRRVGKIARVLKVNPWALNYAEMLQFHDNKGPAWDEVVLSLNFSKELTRKILSLPGPEKKK